MPRAAPFAASEVALNAATPQPQRAPCSLVPVYEKCPSGSLTASGA